MKFFIQPSRSAAPSQIAQKDLEKKLNFTYSDKVTPAPTFSLHLPYNLAANKDIDSVSNERKQRTFLPNPEDFLVLTFVSEECGYGITAKQTIPANTVITHYAGTVYNIARAPKNDDYQTTTSIPYNSITDIINNPVFKYMAVISADKCGNLSRFFQHLPSMELTLGYEDVASENIRFKSAFDEEKKVPRVLVITTRDIKAGEQLGFDYGKEYWQDKRVFPRFFTKKGRDFSSKVLPKLSMLNESWKRVRNESLVHTDRADPDNVYQAARSFRFFRYTDLCDIACVDKANNNNLTKLLSVIRSQV